VATIKKVVKSKKTKSVEPVYASLCENSATEMERKLTRSYNKLKKDILNKRSLTTLQKDSHELLLLLGEVRFLENECKKLKNRAK
jgi:hypothetical protein